MNNGIKAVAMLSYPGKPKTVSIAEMKICPALLDSQVQGIPGILTVNTKLCLMCVPLDRHASRAGPM